MFFKTSQKMLYISVIKAAFLLLCAMLIQGCKDTVAIFASLENEEKIKTSNFPDKAFIHGMAKLQGNYYVSTGARLWTRKTSASVWSKKGLLHGYSRVSQLVQAKLGEDIYFMAYKERDGDIVERSLFKITTAGIQRVRIANSLSTLSITSEGALFASEKRGDNYAYYRDYESGASEKNLLKDNADGVILDADELNDTIYLLTEGGLYTVSGTALLKVDMRGKDAADDKKTEEQKGHFWGLLAYDSDGDGTKDKLVVSNKNYVWETSDGSTWKFYKAKNDTTFFTDFVYIEQNDFTGLLVGTRHLIGNIGRSEGYRELGKDTTSFKTPSGNKYTSGALHKADVLGFFLDEVERTFFVWTKSSGLWKGTYSAGRAVDWFLE